MTQKTSQKKNTRGHRKSSNPIVLFVFAAISAVAMVLLFGVAITSYLAVASNDPELRNDDFASMGAYAQVEVVDYIPLTNGIEEYEERRGGGSRRTTQTWSYVLTLTTADELIIVEVEDSKDEVVEVGTVVVKQQTENKSEVSLLQDIADEAREYEDTVPEDVGFVELSSIDEYKNSWVIYAVFGAGAAIVALVLYVLGVSAQRKKRQEKEAAQAEAEAEVISVRDTNTQVEEEADKG